MSRMKHHHDIIITFLFSNVRVVCIGMVLKLFWSQSVGILKSLKCSTMTLTSSRNVTYC